MRDKMSRITYVEEEKCYTFCTVFWSEGGIDNVLLVFDETRKFMKAQPNVHYMLKGLTMEETEEKKIKVAMRHKEKIERLLQKLITPKSKKEIRKTETLHIKRSERESLIIEFNLDQLNCSYSININEPKLDELTIMYKVPKEDWDLIVFPLKNIPSFKGVEEYVRSHPKIRMKYINELALHKKAIQSIKHFPK